MKAAVKAAQVPANESRGRLPVAGLVGKSLGSTRRTKAGSPHEARSFAIKNGSRAGWDTARFVAFDAGKNRVAPATRARGRWLRVTADARRRRRPADMGTPPGGSGSSCTSSRAASACERSALADDRGKRTIQLEPRPVWKSSFTTGSMAWRCRFITTRRNHRAASSPALVHPTHWLISTQAARGLERGRARGGARGEARGGDGARRGRRPRRGGRRAAELRRFAAAAQAPAAAPEEPEQRRSRPILRRARRRARRPSTSRDDRAHRRDSRAWTWAASRASARIDALFRVRRSPALAAQLNKIYEHHESIPRYTT